MRRNRFRSVNCVAVGILGTMLLAATALGQQQGPNMPNPRLASVTPGGAKAGTTVEVAFTGTDLEEPQQMIFSHPAIKVEPIFTPPPPPDPKKPPPEPAPKPTINKFKVTIPADVPLGIHDVRMINAWGISNPRAFVVGDLVETAEKEPNNDVQEANRVELNTTTTGTIQAPTDVDYHVFAGKKGQRIVISCLSSTIDSRLQSSIEIYDSKGKRLTSNRHYTGNDALADLTVPEDGDYYVRLCEFTHTQGSADFFYRLSISTAPWIDAIHPCVVEPGKPAQLTIYGRNLPGGQADAATTMDGRVLEKVTVTVNVPKDPAALQRLDYRGRIPPLGTGLDGFEYRIKNAAGSSNPFLLTYARAAVVLDNEKNDTAEAAQEIVLPCEIAGRVEKKRDRDWYIFYAKKGDVYNFELLSERLGAVPDMYFLLRNAANNQDAAPEQDDNNDTLALKLFTRTSDPPVYRFTVPADGKYQLLVASRNADLLAGPQHFYRVRITPDQQDYYLVVMPPSDFNPDGACVRQGSHQFYTVYAWRRDGWNGDITLTVEGLPGGVTCPPQVLGTGLRQATLVVSAAADAPPWAGEIRVRGSAKVGSQTVVREARPASITWPIPPQQNLPTVSRFDRSLVLAVRDKPAFSLAATLDKPAVQQGDKANIVVKVNRLWPDFKQPLNLQVVFQPQNPNQAGELPANLTVNNNNQPLAVPPDKGEGAVVVTVGTNVVPGVYNLVLKGTAQIPFAKDPMAKQKQPIFITLPANPITITILPKQVATVTVNPPAPMLKVGMQTEVVIKVARMHDYAGELKVELVLPATVKGVTADAVTIPAGQDEVKIILKADADAQPGNRNDLIIRATAKLTDAVSAVQEAKLNVNVVK